MRVPTLGPCPCLRESISRSRAGNSWRWRARRAPARPPSSTCWDCSSRSTPARSGARAGRLHRLRLPVLSPPFGTYRTGQRAPRRSLRQARPGRGAPRGARSPRADGRGPPQGPLSGAALGRGAAARRLLPGRVEPPPRGARRRAHRQSRRPPRAGDSRRAAPALRGAARRRPPRHASHGGASRRRPRALSERRSPLLPASRSRRVTREGASWVVAALAAVLVLLLLLPGLGRAPFDDPGEGQHAEIAREAWASGNLLDLRLNGVRYFDKPPLLYWLIALDFRVWGISEWAARLPSVLGAALAVGATALLGARLVDPRTGVLAGTALASSPLFLVFGRYVRPETLFVASIQVGLTGLLLARCEEGGERRHLWAVLGCASLGAAALVKDPLGLLAPLGAVAVALALGGQLRPFRLWLPPVGVALMLVLSLGWYAWAAITQRGFLWYTVVDNHLLNAMGRRRFPDEDVPLAAVEFLAVSALGAFPWVLAAAGTGVSLVRRRAWRDPEEAPWIALAIWLVGLWALVCLSAFRLPHEGPPA